MRREDTGTLLIISTWIIPLIYLSYLSATSQTGFLSYESVSKLGKDPYIFLVDLILFLIGTLLIITGLKTDRSRTLKFINYLYFFPIVNILISGLYSATLNGLPDGLSIYLDGIFITMYNFLILLSLIVIELRVSEISLKSLGKERGIIILISEFIAFAIIRYYTGSSFPLMAAFLIIITATALTLLR
jgi:hypothetical protein